MAALAGVALCSAAVRAQDATWKAVPENANFNNQFNWSTSQVPTGTAFFNTSSITTLSFGTNTTIGGLTLNAGASNYTFVNSNFGQALNFTGSGIVVNGGSATIVNNADGEEINFLNSSSAGSATISNGGVTNSFETLDFSNTSTAGSATIGNADGATIFQDSSTAGNATLINLGGTGDTGFIEFANNASAGHAIINNNSACGFVCSIDFQNASTAANATITNNAGAFLFFFDSSTADSASITNNAGGTITFSDHSTAGSAAITNNGSIKFTNNGENGSAFSTAGSAAITNNAGGTITFSDNSTAGGAAIINNKGGVVDFSPTSGPAGNHQISSGSISGAGNFYLGANALTVGGNNLSTTVSGVISDCGTGGTSCAMFGFGATTGGSLVKVGTGTLKLSGANTYTGATTVNDGTLEVDGSIAQSSLTAVNFNGVLTGTGTVGNTHINGGGLFVPGAARMPGTSTTVAGNLVFQPNAQYAVFLNSSASSFAKVTGTASLDGAVNTVFEGGFARQYTILESAGLNGTRFSGLANANLPVGFFESLRYSADDVFLDLTAGLGASTPLNQNQQNVANALNNFFNAGGTLPPDFLSLFNLTGTNLANALTQIEGQPATFAQLVSLEMMTAFLKLMDPIDSVLGMANGALGFAPDEEATFPPEVALAYDAVLKAPPKQSFAQRWTAWGSGFGGSAVTNGDAAVGSNNVTTGTFGFAAGMDYHFSSDTVLGFALAGGGSNWSLAQGLGTGRSDTFLAGIHGVTRQGPAYVAGALAFANNWFTTNRTALGDQLTASFQGQSYAARLEGGYRFAVPVSHNVVGVTPYAAVQAQAFHAPSYSETDLTAGGFGLSYAAMNGTDTRGELGARFDDLTALDAMPLILRARAAWAHDWVSNPVLNASFESLPGTSFTVFGAPIPHDSALTSAGAQLFFTPNWSFLAKFDGEFAPGSQSYAGTGTLRHTW